jgi:translocation and assembly module TamA
VSVNAYTKDEPQDENWKDSNFRKICGNFFIDSEDFLLLFNDLSFTGNEKILICGGDEPGWKKIPRWQAINNIKNFLSARGYNNPKIKEARASIKIKKGELSKITRIKFLDSPKGFKEFKFLGAEDRIVTSSNLNTIEAWTSSRVKMLGYPCPAVKSYANAKSGKVDVKITSGKKIKIIRVNRDVEEGLRTKSVSRFDAFKKGDFYNGENLALTSRRIINSGIADYSDFSVNCLKDYEQGELDQRLTFSKPQSVVFAFGGTTEELPILKLSWRHARLDHNASSLNAELHLSPVRQSAKINGNLHIFNNAPRLYFVPELKVERFSEETVNSLEQRFVNQSFSVGLGYSYDDSTLAARVESKPTYTIEDQEKGQGLKNVKYLSLESTLTVLSHRFEYNRQSPFTGYALNFNWSFRQKGIGSDFSGNLYGANGTYLLNWGGYDPPLFVLGFRFGYDTLIAADLVTAPNKWRLFLGGGENLRGFARKSINNDALGFRSIGHIGTELRALKILPLNLEPFVFLDVGKVGLNSFAFSSDVLLSPGFGLRWQSPFGALRGTAARGFVSDEDKASLDIEEEWNFYVSLGREF